MQTAALMFETTRPVDDPFGQVVREREAQLLRVAYRILGNWSDAEDVAQEAFLRLHRHGLDFAHEAALCSWLYRVTVNLCLDGVRKSRPTSELPELRAGGASAEGELLRDERKQQLMRALATLPAKERAAVVLREIEGLETAEVAAILGSSEGTVRSQVSKAMTRLRVLLSEEGR
ncbi:MAG: RNA polymerase sigma factor [Acidobacteriota bacterium]|nr:RNA polymerase sigma factor [Acidobacteriota bacterium]